MDTGNRVLWILVAVVFLAVGGLAVAAGLGALPGVDPDTTLLPPVLRRRWHGWGPWAWAVLAGAGLLVALAGLLLARAQLRARGGRPLPDLSRADMAAGAGADPTPPDPGRTQVRAAALARCVERDLARHPAVRRAAVALTGDATAPRLRARLDVNSGTDLHRLQDQLTACIDRLSTTTGLHPASVRVLVRLGEAARVG